MGRVSDELFFQMKKIELRFINMPTSSQLITEGAGS